MSIDPISDELVPVYASQRLTEMPTNIAEGVREAMYADGYLRDHGDGDMQTFSPFGFLEEEYCWLREAYVRTALASLRTGEAR